MTRELFKSRLGFILVSAGCAIGLSNVWKFPYIAGKDGGGFFVLLYIVFTLMIGIPIMCMELSLGRRSRKSPLNMYRAVEPEGTKWHKYGKVCVIADYILMMYYVVVVGWILIYIVKFMAGDFNNVVSSDIISQFNDMKSNLPVVLIAVAVAVAIGISVNIFGIKNGLEKVSKFLMIGLLALIVIMVANSFTLSGLEEGLKFYLVPDMEKVKEVGILTVIFDALSNAFFTLSIGACNIAVMGSYMSKEHSIVKESLTITALNIFVSLMAGLIIFPACFTYGIPVDSGPSLLFVTMSSVFTNMPLGQLWGVLFFVFMAFAALTTFFAISESLISSLMEATDWDRRKTTVINGFVIFVVSIPCILGYVVFTGFHPFGGTSSIMDLEDFIFSNILVPVGALMTVLFCTMKIGWGWKGFLSEANTGKGMKISNSFKGYCKYFLPAVVFFILVAGLYSYIP